MLARRLRRRPNIKSALVQRIVFAGMSPSNIVYATKERTTPTH